MVIIDRRRLDRRRRRGAPPDAARSGQSSFGRGARIRAFVAPLLREMASCVCTASLGGGT
jgi:hypothetical protein